MEAGGVVLRYGAFYGPGTYYAANGGTAQDVRKRHLPVVGRGTGMTSFVPMFVVRLAAGAEAATLATEMRGASNANAKPKAELGWEPAHRTWREGLQSSIKVSPPSRRRRRRPRFPRR